MSNLTIPPEQWLKEMFEFEYCAECGGDAQDHDAVPFGGNWFARCKHPIPDSVLADDAALEAEMERRIERREQGLPIVEG